MRPWLQDEDFFAGFLDVPQQVGAEDDAEVAGLLHLADHADHALAGGRIEPIGRFVEDDEFRTVDDGLRELGELLHAQRIGPECTVAGFAEPDIKQRLVSALEGGFPRQSRKFSHHADERDGRHAGNERIVFRHEADQGSNAVEVGLDVAAEDAGGTAGRFVESEEGIDEGGLARRRWARASRLCGRTESTSGCRE